jgi:type VI secretion system secreted protein VgrG
MRVDTPLGEDVLLLRGFRGEERISGLYCFELDLFAENHRNVAFDQVLGKEITVALPGGKSRYLSGIVSRFSRAARGPDFTEYRAEMVPKLWLLTHRVQSRIFQNTSVPDILRKVFEGLDVTYEIQGTFHPRVYCVQYRESDFDFASRLMEEEGIFYFFKHSSGKHEMVVANTPQSHPEMPVASRAVYEEVIGELREDMRITAWEKVQEIRSGKYTLWDHCFELPHKHLDANKPTLDSVQVGRVSHKLKVGANDDLEIYDYPGAYAKRFDDTGVQKIFEDNARTVNLRMQEEEMPSLAIHGRSDCRQFTAGHKFTLERHFTDDDTYVVTAVRHNADQWESYRSSADVGRLDYSNDFTCIPLSLPFRPRSVTPKPVVHGTQTAVVVGPAGEEIYTDKYSRVKVQFHWDREGKNNADSSCWVRVATFWAGKQWGAIHIPRIGQEVVVDFLEGDPDRPIIVGSVYNADMMPPYSLPDNRTQSGIKSRSSMGGGPSNYNELRFEDKKGKELITLHAEKDLLTEVENDETRTVGHDRTTTIQRHETKTIKEGNETITLERGKQSTTLKMGDQSTTLDMGSQEIRIKMGNQDTKLDLGKSTHEAMQSIELKVGQSSVKLDQAGVTIKGMMIRIEGQIMVQVKGVITQVTADGMLTLRGGVVMVN